MLQVRYFAFDFGERASRIEAAPDQLLAADYSFKAVHQTVLFDTERRYYALLNASGLREAAEVNLRNAEQLKGGGGALSCRAHAHPDALDACPAAAQADYELQAAVRQVDIA